MNKDYIQYTLKKLESAIKDYTTMSREDLAEYVLTCLEILIEENEKLTRESD